jgi:hypothetical protein
MPKTVSGPLCLLLVFPVVTTNQSTEFTMTKTVRSPVEEAAGDTKRTSYVADTDSPSSCCAASIIQMFKLCHSSWLSVKTNNSQSLYSLG